MKLLRFIVGLPRVAAIGMVRVYQRLLSPMLGPVCRFEPSCSNYFIQAVEKYGLIIGGFKGVWRIIRCNPWTPGGHDPP